jgi:signal transduction histidine kinase/CheY-like chemotaxis protein
VSSHESRSPLPAARPTGWLRLWWLNRSVLAKGLAVIAVPLLALTGTVTASLVMQNSESHERAVSIAASALSGSADQVMTDALNAETGVRGYAATGDPLFLAPYDAALRRIGADRRSLRAAAAAEHDRSPQQVLDATTGREFSELAGVRSAVSRGTHAGELIPALEASKKTMDTLRRQVARLAGGPTALQARNRTKITRLVREIEALNLAGLVIGLLVGLAGIALFASGISRRITINAVNAGRLGMGQELEPVVAARDEIGRMSGSLALAERLLTSRAVELTAARDEAVRATQAKTTFLSRTSHELRTPLNSVLGFTQLLQASDLSEEDRDSAGRILDAGRHLLSMINELIDIALIESGELSLSVEPVAVLPLTAEVATMIGPLAAERSITVTCHGGRPGLAVRVDRQRLSQVLVNLVSNAVKYNRRAGTITITCRDGGNGRVSLVVADTGPGLSAENIERIFIPFERLGAEQTAIEGTGIGLPLAKALTEAMGGQLTVSSVVGEGSAFTVCLPRAPDIIDLPVPPLPAGAARPRIAPGTVSTILYIEDNPANVEVVTRYLRARPGIAMQSAGSGRDGLDRARRDLPSIILLDLHLPDIPGESVLDQIRAEPVTSAIPVVVLSAEASPKVVDRVLRKGAHAYLTKPLDLSELGSLLDDLAVAAQDRSAAVR